jgi:hypothetical protein
MAESRRASSARPSTARNRAGRRPLLPHPPRHDPPPRLPHDETPDLQPAVPAAAAPPAGPARPVTADPPRPARPPLAPAPPRTRRELTVLAVLVLGLALNALVLLRHTALSRADVLLGAAVLLSGVALLVLMEVYRR